MGQRRGLREIPGDELDLACLDPPEDGGEPVEVHHLVEAVVDGLPHQRMIGDLAIAGDVLQAGGGVGERGREEIFRLHPLDLAAGSSARPGCRGMASAMFAFQRQWVPNIGASSSA